MDFRKFLIILAVFLLAVLIVQPALSADNLTGLIISERYCDSVTNYTPDLEKDAGTNFYNYGDSPQIKGDYNARHRTLRQGPRVENTTMMKRPMPILYLFQNKAYAQIQLGNYTDAIATLDEGLAVYTRRTPCSGTTRVMHLKNSERPRMHL